MGKQTREKMVETLYKDEGTSLVSPVFGAYGELFVCSNLQGRVNHVDQKEGKLQMVSDQFNTPTSMAFDPDGIMYVCDMAHGAICESKTSSRLSAHSCFPIQCVDGPQQLLRPL